MAWIFLRHKLFYNQLKTLHTSAVVCNTPTINLVKEKKDFQAVWPEVIDSLMTRSKLSQQPEVGKWVEQLLDYTLSGGKLGRGLAVGVGYRMLEKPEYFTEVTLHSARVLGWCLEMLQAVFVVMDDIIDSSTTRRGKPCWYRLPNVGLSAIKDGILIKQSIMEVLEINFKKTHIYMDIISLMNDALLYTAMGEHFDCSLAYNKAKNNIDVFTIEHVNTIAIKTAFYSIKLPIFLTLLLIKNGQEKATKELSDICLEIGRLLQFQDDYMDVYGDETITGKAGTDIKEGKCTWVAVTALERCNETQRSIFKEYYGSKDSEHVKRIKRLYDELHLPVIYEKYERSVYDALVHRIQALPTESETAFLLELLNFCYKRIK